MDPDPGGPEIYESDGSGSATLKDKNFIPNFLMFLNFKVLLTVECSDGVSFCWHLLARIRGVVSHPMRQFLFRLNKPPLLNREGKPGRLL
jgi:hypothetical protein